MDKTPIAATLDGAGRDDRTVITVRASSWSGLFDCAHRWEGEHLLGIRKPAGLRAHMGTSIHVGTAAFDSGRLPGGFLIGVDDAVGIVSDTLRNPEREVDFSKDDLTLREAEAIAMKLTIAYCIDLAPKFTFSSVEQKLKPMDIDCGGGMTVRLTGSMDRARVAETATGRVIADLKTGVGVMERGDVVTKGRSPQLGTYQLLAEHTDGDPAPGAQILALPTSGAPIVKASRVWDARRVMVGTAESPGLIQHAAAMFRSGLFPPNTSSVLCSERYCSRWATCPYHE